MLVPAIILEDWETLEGVQATGPGAMTVYEVYNDGTTRLSADVCCPGCGMVVVSLGSFHVVGPPSAPSCLDEVLFSGCCGWRGRLTSGIWEGV